MYFVESFWAFHLWKLSVFIGQKDCDLPKSAITSLHTSNTFGQLQNQTTNVTDSTNNSRLHVSGGLCDPPNMHQDQVYIVYPISQILFKYKLHLS